MYCSVSNSGRNGELRFRARARFAPESQPRPDALRALADARQSPVPRARAFLEKRAVDALSIVANPQPEKLATVRDLGLNAAGVRVVKGVSQDLARNPVDLVLKERRKRLRRSFHNDLECRRFACHTGRSREFLSCVCEQMFEIALQRRVGPQALNSIAAFGDGLVSLADGPIERVDGLFGALGEQVARGLEREHQPLKALQ